MLKIRHLYLKKKVIIAERVKTILFCKQKYIKLRNKIFFRILAMTKKKTDHDISLNNFSFTL